MKTNLIILIVALVALAIAGGVYVYTQQPQEPPISGTCVVEGAYAEPMSVESSCCDTDNILKQYSYPDEAGDCVDAYSPTVGPTGICIACGNGECGLGENVCNCPEDCESSAQLNDEIVRQLVIEKWGDCTDKCQNFSISVNYNADIPYVAATYDGMYDDSVKTEIISANVINSVEVNQYVIDETSISRGWICQPGRGAQELTQVPCI